MGIVLLFICLFTLSFINGAKITVGPHAIPGGEPSPLPSDEICLPCIQFMQTKMSIMMKIISDVGVVEDCPTLCKYLNDSISVDTCNQLCSIDGIDTFWKTFERANIDPIWGCQLLDACKVTPYPAAEFLDIAIIPSNGPPGTLVKFQILFTAINATGVGQVAYVVYFPSGAQKYIYTQSFDDYPPGDYQINLSFQTDANSSFPVGQYPVVFSLCGGYCGGLSPSSKILAATESGFSLGVTN